MERGIPHLADGFEAEDIIVRAERETGLAEWGDPDFLERFRELVRCIDTEGGVREASRPGAFERLLNLLKGRLTFLADRRRHPEIAEERIVPPLIACGLPRAGTTFMHSLLAQDPDNRTPKTWEITCPSPSPNSASYETDPRISAVQASLDRQGLTAPAVFEAHPFGAALPEECGFIFDYTNLAYFGAFFDIPSYGREMPPVDHRRAYEFHRRFLQTLQFRCKGERWVLKAPTHINRLQELFAVYPDALILQNHRDPAKVISSLASLFGILRSIFSDSMPDAKLVARAQLQSLSDSMRQSMEFREASGLGERFFDVHFVELTGDPLGMIRRIYDHFELEFRDEAVARMQAFLTRDHHARGARHGYTLGDIDLDTDMIEEHFREYIDHYGIAR